MTDTVLGTLHDHFSSHNTFLQIKLKHKIINLASQREDMNLVSLASKLTFLSVTLYNNKIKNFYFSMKNNKTRNILKIKTQFYRSTYKIILAFSVVIYLDQIKTYI